ncbi:hypothetical protein SUDANB5_06740 [Streptomyces sp. SudanB5_2050]
MLALANDPFLREAVGADRASRVTAVSVDKYDEHADLDGVA